MKPFSKLLYIINCFPQRLVGDTADNDTDISLPVVSYVRQLSWERVPELTHTCTEYP